MLLVELHCDYIIRVNRLREMGTTPGVCVKGNRLNKGRNSKKEVGTIPGVRVMGNMLYKGGNAWKRVRIPEKSRQPKAAKHDKTPTYTTGQFWFTSHYIYTEMYYMHTTAINKKFWFA